MGNRQHIIKSLVVGMALIIILFSDFLAQISSVFKFTDELIPLFLGCCVIVKFFRGGGRLPNSKLTYNLIIMGCFLTGVALIGMVSNVIFHYQPFNSVLADAFIVFKGFLTYIFSCLLFTSDPFKDVRGTINTLLKGLTLGIFIVTLINYIYPIYPIEDQRMGIDSQKLMFTAPTYLATFGVCLVALLSRFLEEYKTNFYYIILANFIIASTLRSKGLMFIAIYVLLFFFLIIKKKRLTKKMLIIIGCVGVLIGSTQMHKYISNPDWARSALMINSFNVANDHFPLGGGFATFATWESGESYSPLYEKYGLDQIWGLQPDDYGFVGDTYWPAIIGQFGYIGLALVLFAIVIIFLNISMEQNRFKYFQRMSVLAYLLILSTAETSFMSPVGPLLCLLLVI